MEVPKLGNSWIDYDTKEVKARCIDCQREIETTIGEFHAKFVRNSQWRSIKSQKTFRFFSLEFTITVWKRSPKERV